MDVVLYISTILLDEDEVGIPGLGTFYKKKSSIYFDPDQNKYFPAGLQLSFKEDAPSNRSLSKYISKIKHISEPSADYFAEKLGIQLKKELEEKGILAFGELGVFNSSESGYTFRANSSSYSPESFGLIPVSEPEYITQKNNNIIVDVIPPVGLLSTEIEDEHFRELLDDVPEHSEIDENLIESSSSPIPEPIFTEKEDSFESEKYPSETSSTNAIGSDIPLEQDYEGGRHILPNTDEDIFTEEIEFDNPSTSKSWIKETLAVIAVASLTFAGFFYRNELSMLLLKPNTPSGIEHKEVLPFEQPKTLNDTLTSADSIVEALRKNGLNAEKPVDTVTKVTTKAENINAPGKVKSFDIIGPSFSKSSQAQKFIRNMRFKGVYAYIVKGLPGPRIKVGLGSFKDQASAMAELLRIQKDIYPGATVLPIK